MKGTQPMNEMRAIKKWDQPCPDDGVYDGIPSDVYHKIDALNASTIKAFCQSGIHGEHQLTREDNSAGAELLFGQAFHSAVLEPDDFNERLHLFEDTGIGPTADVAHRKYAEQHPEAIAMRKGWIEKIRAMQYRINKHPSYENVRQSEGQNELTFIWRSVVEIDGDRVVVPCKARCDRFMSEFVPWDGANPVQGIVDLKTCRDSSVDGFERAIGNFKYHIQAAWYLAGAIKCGLMSGLHDNAYTIIAVEKTPPYPVGVYPINTASLQYGVRECERGMREYLKYRLHGHADGPTDYSLTMGVPAWAMPADA